MTDKLKSALIKFAKTFLPLLFGLFIFWLVFRKMDFTEILSILKRDANYWIIGLSLPFGFIANLARAYRWDLLIRPLGYHPKKTNLVYAILGNYGVNLVFPRLGEVWRCTMITRYEKIPFPKLFGTLITDRLADAISVASLTVVAFVMNISYFKKFFAQYPEIFDELYNIITSFWIYVAIAAIILFVWLLFRFFGHFIWIQKTKEFCKSIWEGIHSIVNMKERKLFIFYTILIWLGYYLYFYICFFAFPFTEHLTWNQGLIAFVMSSIAVAVPVQGSIGPWHAMVIAVLMGFGVVSTNAGAFAFCVHTVQQLIFTSALGLFGVIALPIANRKS